MTVSELINELSKYPQDMEVVYDVFEEGPEMINFIDGAYTHTDEYGDTRLHLYED